MSFWCLQFSQKRNENNSPWGTIEVKSNYFVRFLGEMKIPKRHFEIKWPLVEVKIIRSTNLRPWSKCFSYTTKTRPNLATYTRKPGNNNGTIVFEIDIMKKSYPVNLKFTSLPLSKPKWQFFSGAGSWCSQ